MTKEISQPRQIHLRIVEVMKRFPEGISGGKIRHELEREGIPPEDLGHLGRRIRELDKWFIIGRTRVTQASGSNKPVIHGEGQITETLRAEVLYGARGRCEHCGKTIQKDGITLVVDRGCPEGHTDCRDDLWAICEECSAAKEAHLVQPIIAGVRPRFKCCRMSS